ncbi:MAG TPA: oligopeptide transporter, OPT family [Bryobacteraceae bacterium]|nr:oligopeptide transporter, OPT family [Bryobacteraceae bacterium]
MSSGTAEWTLKAVVTGVSLGLIFGAANAYLGLRVGLTVSASIPAAVMTVAVFRLLGRGGTILEANLSQTIGSASTSLATGTIFTIPALFMWGMVPPYWQVVALAWLGAILGLAAMIPLRRLLIVKAHDELPYPEGAACAEVLRATSGESTAGVWIFRGMAAGIAVKLAISLLFLMPASIDTAVPVLPKADVALELAPALMGVGYILGYRQSAILVAGSVVSALLLTPLIAFFGGGLPAPLAPEPVKLIRDMTSAEIWSRYVRYIGAGAVAVAGIITVARGLPAMAAAFAAVARGMTSQNAGANASDERDRDLPGWFTVSGIVSVVVISAVVPGVFAGDMNAAQRAVAACGVAVFGLLFVTVAARIVGIVGVSSQPTSGVTLVTLIGVASVFAAVGWVNDAARAAVLTVGTVVAVAASKAGDISQDLKTGWLVGATPAKQQLGQLVGASFACWGVAATVLLLGSAYTFGSRDIPAPQATLMKTIVEGVLAGVLPWGLVLSGGGLAVGALLTGVSPLAFAIGVYLPLGTMAAIFVGGCIRLLTGSSAEKASGDPGVLAASGLVAGEGLAGVVIAGLVAAGLVPKAVEPRLPGIAGDAAVFLTIIAVALLLYVASRSAGSQASEHSA